MAPWNDPLPPCRLLLAVLEPTMSKWGMRIGGQVDIKRSDGRVHAAVVSGFNEATESVTVEWFENQETKGKELDLNHLASLNPSVQAALRPLKEAAVEASRTPVKAAEPIRRATKITKAKKSASAATPAEKENDKAARSEKPKASKDKAFNKIQDIAAKREERRAKQDQKSKKNEVEKANRADNPNWEFGRMVSDYRATRKIVAGMPAGMAPAEKKITVCVRKRPMNKKELARFDVDVTTIPDGANTLVHECKAKVDLTKFLDNHQFRFDHSFDETVDNRTVYTYSAAPLVKTIFDNGMATCFAYGQTGSGKTFTMGGEFAEGSKVPDTSAGIYAMAAADVFRLNKDPVNKAKNLKISVSYFEIYGGKVFDLLNGQKRLRVLEDGKGQVNIVGLAEKVVVGIKDVLSLLKDGTEMRSSGTTSANQNSSRSHAIFQLLLRNDKRKVHGKFSLIDLAGNERGADTMSANRQTRMEGAEINKSLLALKECIRALSMNRKHIPYRASKLTQVLRDSFIGTKARTAMIAMVSPGLASCENTLNTLRYADRVKELKKDKSVLRDGAAATATAAEPAATPAEPDPTDLELDLDDEDDDDDDGNWLEEESPLENSLARQDLKELHKSLKIKDRNQNQSLYNFHTAMAEVVEAEERVEEEHRSVMQFSRDMMAEEEKLLDAINTPDYDVEDYARRLDEILGAKLAKLTALRENVAAFRKQLKQEEQASKQVGNAGLGM